MTDKLIRVLCADDTDIAVQGMSRILEYAPRIVVVARVTRLQDVAKAVREAKPCVVLLDLKWGGVFHAGQELIRQIKEQSPDVAIIAVTVHDHLVAQARQAGADDVVTKDITSADLTARIEAAARCGASGLPGTRPHGG